MTDKAVIYYQRKQLRSMWRGKPEYNIGTKVIVRKDARSVYGQWYDDIRGEWKQDVLISGFDKCRQQLIGKTGVVVEIWEGDNGGHPHFMYRIKFDRRGIVTMVKEWLRRK